MHTLENGNHDTHLWSPTHGQINNSFGQSITTICTRPETRLGGWVETHRPNTAVLDIRTEEWNFSWELIPKYEFVEITAWRVVRFSGKTP